MSVPIDGDEQCDCVNGSDAKVRDDDGIAKANERSSQNFVDDLRTKEHLRPRQDVMI